MEVNVFLPLKWHFFRIFLCLFPAVSVSAHRYLKVAMVFLKVAGKSLALVADEFYYDSPDVVQQFGVLALFHGLHNEAGQSLFIGHGFPPFSP